MKTDREMLTTFINDHVCKEAEIDAHCLDKGSCNECLADYLISNGVTIPVRCGECEKEQECKNAQYLGENGFCSYGERKEDVPDTKDGKCSKKPNSWEDRLLKVFLGGNE